MDNTIIIPTYNSVHGLSECIRSVKAHTDEADLARTEILVVANGCRDGTEDYVRSLGDVRLLSFPDPMGFTGATNEGIRASDAKRVILLNDDCVILDWGGNWIRMLEAPFDSEPAMAVTGSNRDVWRRGDYFIVFCCSMLRRDVLDELGLLDMAFNPGCGEDADFCLKARARGYKTRQVPVEHDHWRTAFPLWHVGHMTICRLAGFKEVATRNTGILEERYPRTDEDRALQKAFSDGLQNDAIWAKKA